MKFNFSYPELKNPYTDKNPENFTKQEAKQYLEWRIKIIPERLNLLEIAMDKSSSILGEFEFNSFSPDSLDLIWNWAIQFIEAKLPTDQEFEQIKADSNLDQFIIDGFEKRNYIKMSEVTYKLSFDIGMYFGHVVINNILKSKWLLRKLPLNCVGVGTKKYDVIAEDCVLGLFRQHLSGNERKLKRRTPLKKFYDIHSKMMI